MKPRHLALCGVFGAAALILPVFFHMLRLGSTFMPMYLPLVALAFFVPSGVAALTALIVPPLSGAVTGMPPFYPPIAIVMAIELSLMTFLISTIRHKWPRLKPLPLLFAVLLFGRIFSACLYYLAALIYNLPPKFIAGISLLSGWPGIVMMLIVMPQIVRFTPPHE